MITYLGVTTNHLKNRSLSIFLFFISFITYGQFYHGIEIGATMNNADFKINESVDPSSSYGFMLGYVAEREISNNIYVRLACNFTKRPFNAISRKGINTSEEKWNLDAIEIPMNLGYYLNWNNRNFQFFIDGGINVGLNFRAITKTTEETIHLDIGGDGAVKRIALGGNIGAGLLIKKRTKIRLNYYNSLSSITNTAQEGDIWKNKTIGLSISYFLRDKQVY